MDPLPEEEIIEEIIKSPRSERATNPQTSPVVETSTSTHGQQLGKQHSAEISSTGPQSKQGSDIKRTFMDIKAQNEPVRLQLYDRFLKMTPTKQQRLMSTYDIKEGKMILSHFKPKVQQPQSAVDYIRTNLEALAKDTHLLDQIELHKQTGEMVYSTLVDKAMLAQQLQNSLNNTSAQLELEKAYSLAKEIG